MKNKNLKIIILLFALLCAIQLMSGILLFFYKIGFNYELITEYFLGNEEKFMLKKEFNGLLETSMYHLVAQVGVAFIISHFVLFIQKSSKFLIAVGYSVIVFAIVDIVAPYFIIYFGTYFVLLKIFGFVGFELATFYILTQLLLDKNL
jgi:hypothetical protein